MQWFYTAILLTLSYSLLNHLNQFLSAYQTFLTIFFNNFHSLFTHFQSLNATPATNLHLRITYECSINLFTRVLYINQFFVKLLPPHPQFETCLLVNTNERLQLCLQSDSINRYFRIMESLCIYILLEPRYPHPQDLNKVLSEIQGFFKSFQIHYCTI